VINSLYLSGWEYNRLLSDDPTSPRNSALPASILWNGAHQLWMFEHLYVTQEAWQNEHYATEQLGWIMGDVLSFLQDEDIVKILDWSEFDADLRGSLRAVHRDLAPHARMVIPKAISAGVPSHLEMFKNALLAPVLRRYGCVASGAPTSLETWIPQHAPTASESDTSQVMRSIAEPLLPGIQLVGAPASLASDLEREEELRVQAEVETPMIPDLIAGQGEYAGAQGYVPYVDALKKERAAYEGMNQKMRQAWRESRDEIKGLREAAHDHLWEHLHGEWLPRIQEGDGKFVREELPRLIGLALKARPFARYLDSPKTTRVIVGGVHAAVSAAAYAAATKTGLPPEYVGIGANAAAGVAEETAVNRYGTQAKQVVDLAVFYQRAKK
jgi:hypothetical protein